MKRCFVLSLLLLFSVQGLVHAVNDDPSVIGIESRDSIMNHFRSLPLNEDRCWQECCSYLANIAYPWASSILELVIEDARTIKDAPHLSYGLYYSIYTLSDKCDTVMTAPLLDELKSLFPDSTAQLNYFRSLALINDAHIESMNFEAAFTQLEFMEKEAQECGLHSALLMAWTQRAGIYLATGRYEEAIDILTIVTQDENGDESDRISAYFGISEAFVSKKEFENAISALDKVAVLLNKLDCGLPEKNTNSYNYFKLEWAYARIWCLLENPEKVKEHIAGMERYYVDTAESPLYLYYHHVLAYYFLMSGYLSDAEDEIMRCFDFCEEEGVDDFDLRDLMLLKSEVKYLQGKKDTACLIYSDYLRSIEAFHTASVKQQREGVTADFYSKKGYAGREQFVNWQLKVLSFILIAGILVFSLLFFWKSRIVRQEEKVSLELNRSYLAAEQANREREEILLNIRESISQPLGVVLHNAGIMNSGKSLDAGTKSSVCAQINENAAILNTIISEFLNKARADAGKSRI